jgi:hypothetical protein
MREVGERDRARKREGVYLCACGMEGCVMSPEDISSGLYYGKKGRAREDSMDHSSGSQGRASAQRVCGQ